ncbi:MAG: hypothetical protein FWG45_00300 [Oscillospiraceae bacterium]|nr:hypothetical protein [Oscillospiraceae bacterium]
MKHAKSKIVSLLLAGAIGASLLPMSISAAVTPPPVNDVHVYSIDEQLELEWVQLEVLCAKYNEIKDRDDVSDAEKEQYLARIDATKTRIVELQKQEQSINTAVTTALNYQSPGQVTMPGVSPEEPFNSVTTTLVAPPDTTNSVTTVPVATPDTPYSVTTTSPDTRQPVTGSTVKDEPTPDEPGTPGRLPTLDLEKDWGESFELGLLSDVCATSNMSYRTHTGLIYLRFSAYGYPPQIVKASLFDDATGELVQTYTIALKTGDMTGITFENLKSSNTYSFTFENVSNTTLNANVMVSQYEMFAIPPPDFITCAVCKTASAPDGTFNCDCIVYNVCKWCGIPTGDADDCGKCEKPNDMIFCERCGNYHYEECRYDYHDFNTCWQDETGWNCVCGTCPWFYFYETCGKCGALMMAGYDCFCGEIVDCCGLPYYKCTCYDYFCEDCGNWQSSSKPHDCKYESDYFCENCQSWYSAAYPCDCFYSDKVCPDCGELVNGYAPCSCFKYQKECYWNSPNDNACFCKVCPWVLPPQQPDCKRCGAFGDCDCKKDVLHQYCCEGCDRQVIVNQTIVIIVMPGDVTGTGGRVELEDALQILRHVVGLSSKLDKCQASYDAACITGGTKPQMADALQILRYKVKLTSVFDDIYADMDKTIEDAIENAVIA